MGLDIGVVVSARDTGVGGLGKRPMRTWAVLAATVHYLGNVAVGGTQGRSASDLDDGADWRLVGVS